MSMSNKICHPFHLVEQSPWPLAISVRRIGVTSGLVIIFHENSLVLLKLSLILLILTSAQWWRDVVREATFQGLHTEIVQTGLRIGIVLFIISEVMFFFSFFWAFFHRSVSPGVELGAQWPPLGIQPFNAFSVPLLNTIILLSRGVRITGSHHHLLKKNLLDSEFSMLVTIFLGIYFTLVQLIEYLEAPFSIADSSYGRSFFVATGFHGFHVLVGTLFLFISYLRLKNHHFTSRQHVGFETAAWYWHFVDVVWLFLFVSIYWWGGI